MTNNTTKNTHSNTRKTKTMDETENNVMVNKRKMNNNNINNMKNMKDTMNAKDDMKTMTGMMRKNTHKMNKAKGDSNKKKNIGKMLMMTKIVKVGCNEN